MGREEMLRASAAHWDSEAEKATEAYARTRALGNAASIRSKMGSVVVRIRLQGSAIGHLPNHFGMETMKVGQTYIDATRDEWMRMLVAVQSQPAEDMAAGVGSTRQQYDFAVRGIESFLDATERRIAKGLNLKG